MTINEPNWGANLAPTIPPPPAPPLSAYIPEKRETATAPFVLGLIGTALGLIPILCYPAIICALIGLVLGVVAYRHRPRKRLARTAIVLSLVGIAFSIIGMVIVNNAINDIDDSFDELEQIFVTTTTR